MVAHLFFAHRSLLASSLPTFIHLSLHRIPILPLAVITPASSSSSTHSTHTACVPPPARSPLRYLTSLHQSRSACHSMNNEHSTTHTSVDPDWDATVPSQYLNPTASPHSHPSEPLFPSQSPVTAPQNPHLPSQSRLFLQTPGSQQLDLDHAQDPSSNNLQPSSASTASPYSLSHSPGAGQHHHISFSPTSHISNYSQEFDVDGVNMDRFGENESILRRRRRTSFNLEEQPSEHAPRSRSVASRSSTSTTRERMATVPESPTLSSVGSKRSSIIHNRSSVVGLPTAEHSGGWMSGLSDVMTNVSSRVVNIRAQEQLPSRPLQFPQGELSDSEQNDNQRSSQRNSFQHDAPVNPDGSPRITPASNVAGSDHGSAQMARQSGSKRSSGSHAGGTNLGVRTSQQGNRATIQNTDYSRSGTGSHLGKSNSALPEKAYQADEESTFTPGGFVHRATDKMRLEGRSLMIFSPENPIRLWLASVLMSKYTDPFILVVILTQWVFFVITPMTREIKNEFGTYWTQYGLLAVNILYT
ncbi:hypothetical protein EDD21DRAFT_376485 [Dissophora ornata]|nr:hypothetical protein EDD21DRAFT_376485 [Dissophora ornata]